MLLLAPQPAYAHDYPGLFSDEGEFLQEDVTVTTYAIFWIWSLHDRIHWIFIFLMLWTCYNFRDFLGRQLFGHPRAYFRPERPRSWFGEVRLHRLHRYFWMANVVLIGIHWHEAITGWAFGAQYTYRFGLSRIFEFTSVQQIAGIGLEAFYLAAFTLWLASCHFFRYACGGKAICVGCKSRGRFCSGQSRLNQRHSVFMWLAVVSIVLLLVFEGHL